MNRNSIIALVVSLVVSLSTFAQKNEIKAAEKAFKKKNYPAVLSAISQAESSIDGADAKTQAKFYYLKGMALYADGTKSENIDGVISSFNMLKEVEKKSGASKYSNEASVIITNIIQEINKDAYAAYTDAQANKDDESYKKAADGYAKIYRLLPADTVYLYNSAMINTVAKEYKKSNAQYDELLNLGYTGIATVYSATSTVNDEKINYSSKKEMDNEVRMKIAKNPTTEISKSKYISMIKSVASNYLALDNDEKALEFIAKARKESPNDFNLIIEEGNIYFKMGDKEKFKEKLEEAIKVNPTNPQLYYNVGIMNSELGNVDEAIKNLKKSIEFDAENANTYNALGNIILSKADKVQKEMNDNAMDFKKYDKIKEEKYFPILREALPYIEKSYELEKDDTVRTQLNNIYENLGLDKRVD